MSELAAGFLRIPDGAEPLDASAVHPESYGVVERILEKTHLSVKELIGNRLILDKLHPADFVEVFFPVSVQSMWPMASERIPESFGNLRFHLSGLKSLFFFPLTTK